MNASTAAACCLFSIHQKSDTMTSHIPHRLSAATLTELNEIQDSPCLSLYQPTHRNHPDNRQDPIRFGELVKTLAASLTSQPKQDVTALLAPFERLAEDRHFWEHTLDGLAVLAGPNRFQVFLLQCAVPELAVVADSFHTKPLRHYLQSVDRYQVLALSLNKVQLFEGNRHMLDEVTLEDTVPKAMADLPIDKDNEPHSTVSSYGGMGTGHMAMHHGQGGKKDNMDRDTERFFRAVDRAIHEHHSQPSGLPLMLAALPGHHSLFHTVSHNPLLMPRGLLLNPDSLSPSDLQQRAWEVAAPLQHAKRTDWCNAYAIAVAKGQGSKDLANVAQAAVAGRVASVLIESGRQVAGRIDPSTGRIDHAPLHHPRVDDVLDDLGALVEKMGGQVHVMSGKHMPTDTGVAAILRH
jgi:hypothetical protein